MPSIRRLAEARKAFTISNDPSISFSGINGQIDMTSTGTLSGKAIDERSALRIGAVWIANTLIADEVSSLVFKLGERGDASRRPVQPEELAPLWRMPNPDQTVQDWLATSSLSLTLWGVSLTQLGWRNDGSLGVMWPIDPSNVSYERLPDMGVRMTSYGQGSLENHPERRPEFMMIPLFRLPGQLEPMSPVRYAAELLGLGSTYDEVASKLAGRGFNPAAVLTMNQSIEDEDAKKLSDRLMKLHGGTNRGKVAVIGGVDPKLTPFSMSLADAQFVAQNDRVFALTMALWRVPPTVVGMVDKPSTWGTGVAEFARGLERFTLRPIVQRLQGGVETFVTRWVDDRLQWRGRFDSLLSAAPKDRTEIQRLALMNGMTSVERVLAQNDEPPFGDEETVFSALSQATDEDRALERLKKRAEAARALFQAGISQEAAFAAVGLDIPPGEPGASEGDDDGTDV